MQTGGSNSQSRMDAVRLRRQHCRAGDKGAPHHKSHAVSHGTREEGYLTCHATRRPCAPKVCSFSAKTWVAQAKPWIREECQSPLATPSRACAAQSCMRGPIVHARPNRACATCPGPVVTQAAERCRSARLVERPVQTTESPEGSVRPVVGSCNSRLQRTHVRPSREPSQDSRGGACACVSLTGWSRSWAAMCRASRCTSQRLSPPLIQDQSLLPRLTAMIAACAL